MSRISWHSFTDYSADRTALGSPRIFSPWFLPSLSPPRLYLPSSHFCSAPSPALAPLAPLAVAPDPAPSTSAYPAPVRAVPPPALAASSPPPPRDSPPHRPLLPGPPLSRRQLRSRCKDNRR
eukprot:748802-Hanusia_phi.AAC.5